MTEAKGGAWKPAVGRAAPGMPTLVVAALAGPHLEAGAKRLQACVEWNGLRESVRRDPSSVLGEELSIGDVRGHVPRPSRVFNHFPQPDLGGETRERGCPVRVSHPPSPSSPGRARTKTTKAPTSVVLVLHHRLIGRVKAHVGDDSVAVEDHRQAIGGGGEYWGCPRAEPSQRKRFSLRAIKDFNEVIRTAVELFQPVK